MKKLLLVVLFLPGFLAAQNFHWISEQSVIGFSGGQFHPDVRDFNKQLTAWGAKSGFSQGLRGYGITFAGTAANKRNHQWDAAVAFDLLLPSNVSTGPDDSLHFRMKGWRLMTSIYGKDVIPGSSVALVIAPGIDWGVLKMTRTLKGNSGLYKNIYIAPLVRAELRFVLGPVALGARGSYRYDISKSRWKQASGDPFALPGTKNTGPAIEFFVGWGRTG